MFEPFVPVAPGLYGPMGPTVNGWWPWVWQMQLVTAALLIVLAIVATAASLAEHRSHRPTPSERGEPLSAGQRR